MTPEEELETKTRVADARLGLVEDLRWTIAPLAAIAVQHYWHTWPISVGVGIIAFFAIPYPFSKESDRAQDAYERFTGTGKYWRSKEQIRSPQTTTGSSAPDRV
jgi:hypothetical protein